jgi:hypothetical protein
MEVQLDLNSRHLHASTHQVLGCQPHRVAHCEHDKNNLLVVTLVSLLYMNEWNNLDDQIQEMSTRTPNFTT